MNMRVPLLLLAVAVLAALACGDAAAQRGGVVITSTPPGAVVALSGDHEFRGITPWRLNRGLVGAYDVQAVMRGYENWDGRTFLSGTQRDSLNIRLMPKTPLKAGVRSAILPGWGQYYNDQRQKGTLFFLAEVAALGGTLWADVRRQDAMDAFEAARREYRLAEQVDGMDAAYEVMLRKFDDLEKWDGRRRRLAYVAAAVWLANVVDATVLFPAPARDSYTMTPMRDGSGPFAAFEADRSSLGVSIQF